jgi:predicted acetyltransferase
VLARPEQARPHELAVYEAVRPDTVGFLARPGTWPDRTLTHDPEHGRGGASARRHVLWTEQDGTVTGFATYRTKENWTRAENTSEVRVQELYGTTPQARAGLWTFLAGIDLHPVLVRDKAPLDDPLLSQLVDARAVVAEVYDSLWIRLADVGRGLAARTYRAPVDVVLDVRDEFCPWNVGTWRLSGDATGATCERTGDPADLTLSARELGAAYLGGPTLAAMAAAGLVTGSPAALAAASLAFSGERMPWCPEVF